MTRRPDARPSRPTRDERFMCHALDAHGSAVYVVALAQTRSTHDAQDVAQDVFLRLLTADTPFTSEDHLRAWLLRVTVNRCRELGRLAWNRRVDGADDRLLELPGDLPDPGDAAVAALTESPVWRALRQLPDKLRVVALLFYVEELPTAQIAQVVGCSPATVRTRLHRARAQLRDALTSETEENHETPEPLPAAYRRAQGPCKGGSAP